MTALEALLHPVRLRIVHAIADGQPFTTTQLGKRLADVPQATIYRHVGALAKAGILESVREQQIRGTVERWYRLRPGQVAGDQKTAAAMTLDDYRRAFGVVIATVMAELETYVNRPNPDPYHDQLSSRLLSIWLTDAERAELIDDILTALCARANNDPTPQRRKHLLATFLLPTDQPNPAGRTSVPRQSD